MNLYAAWYFQRKHVPSEAGTGSGRQHVHQLPGTLHGRHGEEEHPGVLQAPPGVLNGGLGLGGVHLDLLPPRGTPYAGGSTSKAPSSSPQQIQLHPGCGESS